MTVKRIVTLVTVAIVLVVAWRVGRENAEKGIVVALAGLLATYALSVLAIPVVLLIGAVMLYVPDVLAVAILALIVCAVAWSDDSPQMRAVRAMYGRGLR